MKRKRKKPKMWLYVPFWIFIIGMFMGLVVMQLNQYRDYRQELERLAAELRHEQQIAEDLRYQQAFVGSDAYVERLAREWLNFVRQDEILFQNINSPPFP